MDSLRRQPRNDASGARAGQPTPKTVMPPAHARPQSRDPFLSAEKTDHSQHKWRKSTSAQKKISRFFVFAIIIFIAGIITLGTFLTYKFAITAQRISVPATIAETTDATHDDNAVTNETSVFSTLSQLATGADETALRGYDNGRINILLLGIAGTEKPGALLTDTIILASINTTDHTVALLSIPRDLLVASGNTYHKINSLYAADAKTDNPTENIINAVATITGQPVHYYLVMDFAGFTTVIDALGGINIDVAHDIHDTRYPGAGYSYETFDITAGLHHMDGATALKYARSRHDDPESDFGRAKRQQKVLRAARNKAFTLGTITNPFKINDLLNAIADNVTMNVTPEEIPAFVALVKNLDTQNITTVVLDAWQKDSLLRSARIGNLPGLVPRSGDWRETQDLAENIFALTTLRERRASVISESAHVLLVNTTTKPITAHIESFLSGAGFEEIATMSAPRGTIAAPTTRVFDRTDGKKIFALDELLKKLDATKTTTLPKSFYTDATHETLLNTLPASDFIVILGNDQVERHDYTDATQEEIEKSNTLENDAL